jgi:hypothetical protein
MEVLTKQFEELRKAIEPSEPRKRDAKKADDPVREHLEAHQSFAEHHITTFLYGSYKRRTAICDIKDVDLVVVTNYTTDDKPLDVLCDLKDSLADLYDEPDLADQRRSIRINRPLSDDPDCELTLDVIPAIYVDEEGGPLWVPDREKEKWVKSHPQGHIDNTSQLNADSDNGKTFVRLTKMMKWWWQYQWERLNPSGESHQRKPKGFWIEVMCGQYADLEKESYPEQIVALMQSAFDDFESYRNSDLIPELIDPGLPDQMIETSITGAEFSVFLNILEKSLGDARAACDAKDERTAAQHWRKLFGDKFPLPSDESKSSSLLKAAAAPAGLSFPDKPLIPSKPAGFA